MNQLLNRNTLKKIIKIFQDKSKKIVFTNGCFDILHPGHVDYLQKAKNLGDLLVVGLNSDNSVRKLKGDGRPINSHIYRATMLLALASVDYVCVFEEDTPAELIQEVDPQYLVKGGDYKISNIVGADFVIGRGNKVEIIPFLPGYNTTNIIQKIKQS